MRLVEETSTEFRFQLSVRNVTSVDSCELLLIVIFFIGMFECFPFSRIV